DDGAGSQRDELGVPTQTAAPLGLREPLLPRQRRAESFGCVGERGEANVAVHRPFVGYQAPDHYTTLGVVARVGHGHRGHSDRSATAGMICAAARAGKKAMRFTSTTAHGTVRISATAGMAAWVVTPSPSATSRHTN